MAQRAIELLNQAIKANQADKYRIGNTIFLPKDAVVTVSGDIHGNKKNYEKIVRFSNLKDNPLNHLILQEIIHGGCEDEFGGCLSYQLILQAAELKLKYPNQVHLIMGNHDTAFISHSEVMKNGKEMNQSIRTSMQRHFGVNAQDVELELARFLFSQPLAVKCANKIMVSHSLPADRQIELFDPQILDQNLKINEIVRPGSVYLFTWGRKQSPAVIEKCIQMFNCEIFIVGHQPQETGFCKISDRLLILASEHSHGMVLKFNCGQDYTVDKLIKVMVPVASLL